MLSLTSRFARTMLLATTVAVAAVVHRLSPEIGWGAAFVLGFGGAADPKKRHAPRAARTTSAPTPPTIHTIDRF